MARREKPASTDQLDFFAPAPLPPKPPMVAPQAGAQARPEPASLPMRGALPASMRDEAVPLPDGACASGAEAVLAMAIARWEPLIHLWEGGTPGVCAPYVGNADGGGAWKARWMATADAERVLLLVRYAQHGQHEGPLPDGGGTRRAQVWRRADEDQRGFAVPLAVVAVELGVADLLEALAVARQHPVP